MRVETGTINRAIYQIMMLYQPGQPEPSPWTPSPNWNGRLVYSFGFGCGFPYQQGRVVGMDGGGDLLTNLSLADGYAIASSTLNVFAQNCNDVVSAETAMMVKEHFIKQYGPPAYTIGWGGSGGSMQQHLIAQNYPGLLDGIMPKSSFPDAIVQRQIETDCHLLNNYFTSHPGNWTDDQKQTVGGYITWSTCQGIGRGPALTSKCAGLGELGYDPASNPKGARCDYQDYMVNVYGKEPKTGFARRPFDNTGVEYGLVGLNEGLITPEEFLDLNSQIGGLDIDGNSVPQRMQADPEVARIAYETGRVDSANGGLALIPIVDLRPYIELDNVHNRLRSLSMQKRLVAVNGYNNQVSLTFPGEGPNAAGLNIFAKEAEKAVLLMDAWIGNIRNDKSNDPVAVKMLRDKPAELVDACWTATGEKIADPLTADKGTPCNKLYPFYSDPRVAAGAPVADEPLKCALKPISMSDHKGFSVEQLNQLRAIFPDGVCDYSKLAVGKVPLRGTWLVYSNNEWQTAATK